MEAEPVQLEELFDAPPSWSARSLVEFVLLQPAGPTSGAATAPDAKEPDEPTETEEITAPDAI